MVRAASRAACDGAGSEPATGHARRQGSAGAGGHGASCSYAADNGGDSPGGMPLILKRREHPGTFLGVACPFGT
eukprot:2535499-Prymnesium_polylepis.1